MEKVRQKPGKKEGNQGGTQGQTGEQSDHRRVRSLSEEVPGMQAMLSDPGEPHKGIEQHSRQPEQAHKNVSQLHPLLGDQTVSMQNEQEEQARRKMEAERTAKGASKKKPAA